MLIAAASSPTAADFERIARAREAQYQFGTTAADARRFLRKAISVQIAVRTNMEHGDAEFLMFSPAALRRGFRAKSDSDFLPCEFRPDERLLIIGSFMSVRRASGKTDLP